MKRIDKSERMDSETWLEKAEDKVRNQQTVTHHEALS